MSWLDLLVMVQHAPPTSAVSRAVHGEAAFWGVSEMLQAATVDALNIANWQRQQDKHARKPKPIKRPGLVTDDKRFGNGAIKISDFNAWWDSH